MKGNRRNLEAEADEDEERAKQEDRIQPACCLECKCKTGGHVRKICGAELADQQADAIEHDAGSAAPIDHVFEGRLAALTLPLQEAGKGVTRQTRHLHTDEYHQEMIGGGHQRHAYDSA